MCYFLGVDVGGTKTHALIANDRGQALGFAEGGSGNHQSVGYEGLRNVLQLTVSHALRKAGIRVDADRGRWLRYWWLRLALPNPGAFGCDCIAWLAMPR